MSDDGEGRELPAHLRALIGRGMSERATRSIDRVLKGRVEKLRTGRMSRALKMSGFAVKGTSRAVLDRARGLLEGTGSEEAYTGLAAQMLETFSEMRGLSMKVGQMLSYLDDAMPKEAQRVLALLQRDASPMPWAVVKERLEEELGRPVDRAFAKVEEEPIAAASIGQVHRAWLPDGRAVAVKIQYPGIEEAMTSDLKNARMMSLFKRVLFFRTDTEAILRELEERFLDECDYEKEAAYQEAYYERFRGHPIIIVPEVHREATTRRVLTTTFFEGRSFHEWIEGSPSAEERHLVCRSFFRFYIGSLYLDGLFNCDPHPGNYLFLDDGRIVFLDYGCSRRFTTERVRLWIDLCRSVFSEDRRRVEELAVEIGFVKEGDDYDRESFHELMGYLYQAYLTDGEFDFEGHPPTDTFRRMFTKNPNLFKLNMPADAVFLNRISFGLVSLMAEIGAKLNVRRYASSYFQGLDPDWPLDPFRGRGIGTLDVRPGGG